MLSKTQLKAIRALKQKRGRTAQAKFLIEGVHLCQEALGADVPIDLLLYTQNGFATPNVKKVVVIAQHRGVPNQRISAMDMKSLSDTVAPQGVLAVARRKTPQPSEYSGNVLLLLDRVRDPGNVGTIIRTADAVGVDGVILGQESADPFSPKVLRSTQGSIFHLPVYTEAKPVHVVDHLRKRGYRIYIAEPHAKQLHTHVRYPGRFLLVVGNETRGVSQDLRKMADELIRVPIGGRAESLNVAVATGVILYESLRQRNLRREKRSQKRNRTP